MDLPVPRTVEPMLARLTRKLPLRADCFYEPKWDGFRCIAFRDSHEVDLRSRNGRPLARYFPEVVDALRRLGEPRLVVDGEILARRLGRPDFGSLLARLHPAASRVARLSRETPASFIAFDVLAIGDDDLRGQPFSERRLVLEQVLREPPAGIALTAAARDPETGARWLEPAAGAGVDGVVVKPSTLLYQPGRRAMVKVKRERTADCVVAGFRLFAGEASVASLLLGVHDACGDLVHVGVASSFTERRRRELAEQLCPLTVPLEGHPWERGFGLESRFGSRLAGGVGRWTPDMRLDWSPLGGGLVCEVAYDHWDGDCFRHPARFRRWRPERAPASCTLEQFHDDGSPAGDEAPSA
jgi:ATP-dependent DNA ligase